MPSTNSFHTILAEIKCVLETNCFMCLSSYSVIGVWYYTGKTGNFYRGKGWHLSLPAALGSRTGWVRQGLGWGRAPLFVGLSGLPEHDGFVSATEVGSCGNLASKVSFCQFNLIFFFFLLKGSITRGTPSSSDRNTL